MTEHVHEWESGNYGGFAGAGCRNESCNAILDESEIDNRLNATESLNADETRRQAMEHDCMDDEFRASLFAYATTLEGSE